MYKLIKRLFDVIFGVIALIFFIPLFLPIALILKFTLEGEIFYFQERIGYQNRKFKIIKFATMLKDSPNIGTGMITLSNDSRVSTIGKYLRSSKINELPQIFNIIKGDISFVGPRPLVESMFNHYSLDIQKNIYKVKPGLTGIGSIVFRDEESLFKLSKTNDLHKFYKENISPYKGKLETWYRNNSSFVVDFLIIFFTAYAIIFPKSNAYRKVFKTLPKKQKTNE
jgi:lipopolysaccharide/colanic/teichoic acid biosynthesis glycosyltransferase